MTSEEFEVARLSFKQRITGRKMDLYRNEILKWLQEHNDLSGAQVFDWLKEKFSDFSMSERTVRDYVAKLRKEYAIPKLKITREYLAVPESPMGKQAQVDMGQIKLKNSFGKLVKLYLFTMVLSNSRYKFSQWQTSPFTSKDLIKMHNLAFKYFNGMPKEIVYDQDRALFVNENSGDIILSSEFQKYINLSGLKIHLCRAYDPESKGKVEAVVKYVKYNFAKNRKFTDIEEFNQLNNEWLIRTGNGKSHSITKKVPAEVFAVEKQHLMPIPSSISFCKENTNNIVLYSLGKDNTVTYKSNRYQLPKGTYSTKYKEVRVEIKEDDILFFRSDENTLITSYKISKEKGMLFSHSNFMRDIIGTTALGGLKKDIL